MFTIQHVVYVIKKNSPVSPKMFINERLFTIQAFTITRVHCIATGVCQGPVLAKSKVGPSVHHGWLLENVGSKEGLKIWGCQLLMGINIR